MIAITGATGHLGRLVIESLLKKVPAGEIVAGVRNPDKAGDLAALGVIVRQADYDQPATLATAFAGVEKLLLISSNDLGQRVVQHKAVVDAARAAGVKLIAYTSLLRADTSRLKLAAEHKATEEYMRASGVPFVFLRNGWYTENHTASLGAALAHGAIIGAAGDGRFASATRADYAEATATVLAGDGHANTIYELGGDVPYTYAELAAEVSAQSGKAVQYLNLPPAEYEKALLGFGLPPVLAGILADADAHAADGELTTDAHDLSALLGRPTTPLKQAVAEALRPA